MNAAETQTALLAGETIKIAKATISAEGALGLGFGTMQVRDLEVKVGPYAQYSHAIELTFVKKGGRRRYRMRFDFEPTAVVLEGHVDLELMEASTGVLSFDKAHGDFRDAAIIRAGLKVALDFRGFPTQGRMNP